MPSGLRFDVVVFGGGAAGLWLLDELVRRGYQAILLEGHELGYGQTVGSQGIIHGGLKYTLTGWLTPSARSIREMPRLWRECLTGVRSPNLQGTRVRSECCYLWATQDFASRAGLLGARRGLRSAPLALPAGQSPAVLAQCPSGVFRVDEPVLDVVSFVSQLAAPHSRRLLKIDADGGLEFERSSRAHVTRIRLRAPGRPDALEIEPVAVVFTAGEGNARLRARVGLSEGAMQRRPLHMVLVRGRIPPLHGHCVHGARTRVTITSAEDGAGRCIWQIGGQVAEDGVSMTPRALVEHAKDELLATIPGLDLAGAEWTTYHVDRAEPRTRTGLRPTAAWCRRNGNVVTAWPTKLALAPRLAELVCEQLDPPGRREAACDGPADWPRPVVAQPPWETAKEWFTDV